MNKISYLLISLLMISISSFSLAQKKTMEPETLWEFGRVGGTQISPDGTTLLFSVTHYDVAANNATRQLYTMPVAGGEPQNITTEHSAGSGAVWRPDGKKIGYISSERGTAQLWEMDPDGTNPQQISTIEGGIGSFAYSPDLNNILYIKDVKMEEAAIDKHPDLPLANVAIYEDLMYRHWDTWHDYTFSHIFVAPYNETGIEQGTDIMKDQPYDSPLAPFGGLSHISWTPDGKAIAYTSKKLRGKDKAVSTNSDIYLYTLETGETKNLTAFNQGYDMSPVFSPEGKYMAWESMQTAGFEADKTRIMIMNMADGSYRDYSEGFDQSSEGLTWSKDAKMIYFISGHHATYQIYQLNITDGSISPVTGGRHNYNSVALAGDDLVGTRMSMSSPVEIFRVNKTNGEQVQLTHINKPILDEIEMGKVEERWIETTDEKQMLVWVIYPPHFDANKKYPALLYCGGGPQSAVSQFFSYRWNFQMMAANDYIVIAPNRRGLPTFGQEWNDQISQDYGGQNIEDLMSAAKVVSREPYVDESRLGAVGASYGGFSVFYIAGHHQKLFSAFIAHSGMFNFESWYGTTEELFFANHDLGGPYWDEPRPESYGFSPHLFIKDWDTPIMVMHGAKDYRVPLSEGMQAFNAAQIKGIPSRLVVFPDENHWILKPQNSILWQREFFAWLDQWLK